MGIDMKFCRAFVAILLSAGFGGLVVAQPVCTEGQLVVGPIALQRILSNKTVCASLGAERWKEFHNSSGTLFDYKRGPSDPVDPTKQVGNWSASGTETSAQVTYNYGSGGIYSYYVCALPQVVGATSYTFVGAKTIAGATLRPGQVDCP